MTFTIKRDENGQVQYSVGYAHSSPRRLTISAIYAHKDGFACGNITMGGIGEPWSAPPLPNCIVVVMASDSQGQFGHECPQCHKHFRSSSIPATFPLTCPYCGLREASFHFLTPPQNAYVRHYLKTLSAGMETALPNSTSEIVIDMDKLADEVSEKPRPDFYYTSTTQQTDFRCHACNSFNDVRGRYVYCASCGTRNNIATLRDSLGRLRNRLNRGDATPEESVKQAVSEFDSMARNFVHQLQSRIPMKLSRRNTLKDLLFHNLHKFDQEMRAAFDINLLRGLEADREFIHRMFLRRHVYEHSGGVATARYVRESNEQEIEEGILLRETVENTHRLIGCLSRMAQTFDTDFHEIFPPEPFCINAEQERRARLSLR